MRSESGRHDGGRTWARAFAVCASCISIALAAASMWSLWHTAGALRQTADALQQTTSTVGVEVGGHAGGGASRAVAHVTGTAADGSRIDFVQAVPDGWSAVTMPRGDVEFRWLPRVTEDGRVMRPEASERSGGTVEVRYGGPEKVATLEGYDAVLDELNGATLPDDDWDRIDAGIDAMEKGLPHRASGDLGGLRWEPRLGGER